MHLIQQHGPAFDGQSFKQILALDLGKFNSVLCVYDPKSAAHSSAEVQTIPQRCTICWHRMHPGGAGEDQRIKCVDLAALGRV